MPTFEHRSRLSHPAALAFDWHERPGAFARLAPPWQRIRVLSQQGGIRDGARVVFQLRKAGLWLTWEALHSGYQPPRQFIDEQVRGPFARWRHLHRIDPDRADAGRCELIEQVDYDLPGGRVGRALCSGSVRRDLERVFVWRHQRTARDLSRHAPYEGRPGMRIAIGGASGLVGRQLCAFLAGGGHAMVPLVRGSDAAPVGGIAWNPDRGHIDSTALEGLDAVVHLGGVSIAKRFTAAHKAAVMKSRVESTILLAKALAGLRKPPRTFVVASAIGLYGNRGDELLDEHSSPGTGFLPEVCIAWEKSADAARAAGIRVVHLRIGIVLTPQGGALASMLPPFRAGVGGRLGNGKQIMSWIALDDAIGAIHHALMNDTISGPINLTGPHPISNSEFTAALGRALRRPTLFPVPALAIKLLLGEMGEALLLGSGRAIPRALTNSGFRFLCPTVDDALRWEMGLL